MLTACASSLFPGFLLVSRVTEISSATGRYNLLGLYLSTYVSNSPTHLIWLAVRAKRVRFVTLTACTYYFINILSLPIGQYFFLPRAVASHWLEDLQIQN